MKFKVEIDGVIDAADIDNAFVKLGIYFINLATDLGEGTKTIFESDTHCKIYPHEETAKCK